MVRLDGLRLRLFAAAFAAGHLHDLIGGLAVLQEHFALGLEGPSGADAHALAAKDTGGFGHGFIEEGSDAGFETASTKVNGVGILGIVGTDLHTAPA